MEGALTPVPHPWMVNAHRTSELREEGAALGETHGSVPHGGTYTPLLLCAERGNPELKDSGSKLMTHGVLQDRIAHTGTSS